MLEFFKLSPAYEKRIYREKDLEEAVDLMMKCLRWNPYERITAKDALNHKIFTSD